MYLNIDKVAKSVHNGPKENLCFGIEDNKNVERRSVGKNCECLDD